VALVSVRDKIGDEPAAPFPQPGSAPRRRDRAPRCRTAGGPPAPQAEATEAVAIGIERANRVGPWRVPRSADADCTALSHSNIQ
jgi:hypothetical protein